MLIAILYAHITVPAIAFYLAKEFITLHHAGTTRTVMIEVNISLIKKFLAPPGKMLRDNMGVDVNFKHVDEMVVCKSRELLSCGEGKYDIGICGIID